MKLGIYILNFNGRDLLEECLPSVIGAATTSRYPCSITVVDNSSMDDSLTWLARTYPQVKIIHQPNRGLASYNPVLAASDVDVAVLLNNDIRLADDCIDLLAEPFLKPVAAGERRCFMTAPLCWRFDGRTYEGFRTAIDWRRGMVQATALFPGHKRTRREPGLTASAGAALAVDRQAFVSLGGFDPLYFPGRLEDLDFAFRGYQTGWEAQYVPTAVAFHRGQATFERELGVDASLLLAMRNTLLFQWKNLRHPLHLGRQLFSLPVRLGWNLLRAPMTPKGRRLMSWRALWQALGRVREIRRGPQARTDLRRERQFFERFHPAHMARPAPVIQRAEAEDARERQLAARHPISRWYLCPLTLRLSRRLANSLLRPTHCTLAGAVAAVAAGAMIVAAPLAWLPLAALAVLLAWFCDRLDGPLARRQHRADARGAWLDANLDELSDLGLHICVTIRASQAAMSHWPWLCLVAFLCGKYLFIYGLSVDKNAQVGGEREEPAHPTRARTWLRRLYHLPGNADVRVHLLVLGLATGFLGLELALVAVYYNLRWIVRYAKFVARPAAVPNQRRANEHFPVAMALDGRFAGGEGSGVACFAPGLMPPDIQSPALQSVGPKEAAR